jgi:hypothetical protein
MILSELSLMSLVESLASLPYILGNLLKNIGPKIYYFLWHVYLLFQSALFLKMEQVHFISSFLQFIFHKLSYFSTLNNLDI